MLRKKRFFLFLLVLSGTLVYSLRQHVHFGDVGNHTRISQRLLMYTNCLSNASVDGTYVLRGACFLAIQLLMLILLAYCHGRCRFLVRV